MSEHQPIHSARDRLLQAAATLFYARGINGTGIDAIVDRAGVAKKSLYNNFASKADLVNQYLEARHAEWLGLHDLRLRQAETPRQAILAVFDAYHDHAEHDYERGFRGCGLLNAAAELEADDPGRRAVRLHKEQVEQLVLDQLTHLLPHDPGRAAVLAAHIAFVLEGAMTRAGLEGNSDRIVAARRIVDDMIGAL